MTISEFPAVPSPLGERPDLHPESLLAEYRSVRAATEKLCAPLATEDYGIQAMPEVSPPKWHLAHTSWFFEQFLLLPFLPGYRIFHPRFGLLFNSYYESVGEYFPRPQRGWLSRPTVEEVYRYRGHVDLAMGELLSSLEVRREGEVASRTALGMHHEQQHQELLLTDIKYNFSVNPLRPAYRDGLRVAATPAVPMGWQRVAGGVREIGFAGPGFAFDNETPRHRVWLNDFRLASRPVSNAEYREFIDAGGYQQPEWWLSDGWAAVRQRGWHAPLYWERLDGAWWQFTLGGPKRLEEGEPVCHVSYFEADAYARWRGRRLPSEAEWEIAAGDSAEGGNFVESGRLHPEAAPAGVGLSGLYGDVWEWTQSPYRPYPKFRPHGGALGEYNGKFMCHQWVLRGGSCATPKAHIRPTYRNFFYAADRWQFSGIRLADDND